MKLQLKIITILSVVLSTCIGCKICSTRCFVNQTFVQKTYSGTSVITFDTDSTFKYKIDWYPGVGEPITRQGSGEWKQKNSYLMLEDDFIPKEFEIITTDTFTTDSNYIHFVSSDSLSEDIIPIPFCRIIIADKKVRDTLEADVNGFLHLKRQPDNIEIDYVGYPKYRIQLTEFSRFKLIRIILHEPELYMGNLQLFCKRGDARRLFTKRGIVDSANPYKRKEE